MDKLPKQQWTVSKVLRKFPAAASFFIARELRCPGCGLNRYCTLADVACSYKLDATNLTAALRETCADGSISQNAVLRTSAYSGSEGNFSG